MSEVEVHTKRRRDGLYAEMACYEGVVFLVGTIGHGTTLDQIIERVSSAAESAREEAPETAVRIAVCAVLKTVHAFTGGSAFGRGITNQRESWSVSEVTEAVMRRS